MTDDDASTMEAKLGAIEAAFSARVPATLSILLEEVATSLDRRGLAGAAALFSASQAAYHRQIAEARVHFDEALRDHSRGR